MRATWSMAAGLQQCGQHNGQPRIWIVTAWAELADGARERITIRPKGKCNLAAIVELMNRELSAFESDHGQPSVSAGFTAVAR